MVFDGEVMSEDLNINEAGTQKRRCPNTRRHLALFDVLPKIQAGESPANTLQRKYN